MIEIVCDNCERTFEISADEAGGKVECPMCGDINRVPAKPSGPGTGEAVPGAGGGDLPSPHAAEREVCVVRPAMFRAHPFRFLLVVLLALGGFVLCITASMHEKTGVPGWLAWPGLVIGLAGVIWWVGWWLATHLWIRLSISNKRTIRYAGIIRRHSTEVLHDHVRSVDIQQGFLQRLFNVGYVGIDSAGQDDIEIEIKDIPGPYKVKKLIDQYRTM
ncbi:MAG: PH domain-containing protein [Planctomycetota bacterium]|nr:PH domain-containing protein [Planctomycetota bacterium]